MYLDYFGFTKKPFSIAPDPEFLHLSSKHKLAASLLEYAVLEQGGIALITGEIGSGKTTLLRYFFNQLDEQKIFLGYIDHTHKAWGDLTQWIGVAFSLDLQSLDKANAYKKIKECILSEYAKGKRTLLVVDEAQNLSADTLEELRLLNNINIGNDFLLQIILVGQPELLTLLQKPELAQIAQRISVEYHLEALSYQETHDYIHFRLAKAGGNSKLFDDLAIEKIFQLSGGIPRVINTLCDQSLVYGYSQGLSQIGYGVVLDVARSRRLMKNDLVNIGIPQNELAS